MKAEAVHEQTRYINDVVESLKADGINSQPLLECFVTEIGKAWKAGYEFDRVNDPRLERKIEELKTDFNQRDAMGMR